VVGWAQETHAIPDPIAPLSPDALIGPLARLLRPMVRLMIRAGVTFPVLGDLLRTLYVEVASRDAGPGEAPRSDSRVSLLTGIHRKELRRQRTAPAAEAEPAVVTLNSQLVARWLGDPAYVQPDGRPLPLPRSGPAPSFEALVAGVTRDLRSRAVLDEWVSQGIAMLDPDGRVVLAAAGFMPDGDLDSRLFYFARNLHDHIAAASANVGTTGPAPFVDRSVHYDGLGPDAAAALETYAREAATRLLLDVNRVALALADADDAAAGSAPRATRRVNLGIYLYAADEPAGTEPGVE
jgi:hypothetical protein